MRKKKERKEQRQKAENVKVRAKETKRKGHLLERKENKDGRERERLTLCSCPQKYLRNKERKKTRERGKREVNDRTERNKR